MANEPNVKVATSFEDMDKANKFVKETIKQNSKEIAAWFNNPKLSPNKPRGFKFEFEEEVGYGIKKGSTELESFNAINVVVTKKNNDLKIKTSYPVEYNEN